MFFLEEIDVLKSCSARLVVQVRVHDKDRIPNQSLVVASRNAAEHIGNIQPTVRLVVGGQWEILGYAQLIVMRRDDFLQLFNEGCWVLGHVADVHAGSALSARLSTATRFLPVVLPRDFCTRSIMAYSLRAPASVEPLPSSETIRAGTTNSPSARRAGRLSAIVAGMESDTPSPGPF